MSRALLEASLPRHIGLVIHETSEAMWDQLLGLNLKGAFLTLKAALGYTGTDPVDELLNNSHFSDAKVEVFVKAGSGQWTRIGEYPIARQLTGD
jgi:NAD(P)-dependent dehydrogenase (short-subunit alcohol dehydrogenase family)